MKLSKLLPLAILSSLCLLGLLPTAHAAITPEGDIYPSIPPDWDSSTYGFVGDNAAGSLTVTGGSNLLSYEAWIGYGSSSTGLVTVTGPGSTWTSTGIGIGLDGRGALNITDGATVSSIDSYIGCSSGSTGSVTLDGAGSTWNTHDFEVGYNGNGTLNIFNGATATSSRTTYVADGDGSTGSINFGSSGGTLTTGCLFASPNQLTGTGTINASGLVSDVNLVFDSTASLKRSLTFNQPGQNITLNLDLASDPSNNCDLGVGYKGSGSLTVKNGITVQSANGYIGYCPYSAGVVSVSGTGSTWAHSDWLYVGSCGSGTLMINGGGTAQALCGSIGDRPNSSGVVTVNGKGSTWSTGFDTYVGCNGNGTLNIFNGATVTSSRTTYVAYGDGSTGSINFGSSGGTLTTGCLFASPNQLTGTGTINASGLVSDVDLVFDSTANLKKTLTFNQPGQNVTMNLDLNGYVDGLGAGYRGSGSLTIKNGVIIYSDWIYIGYKSGSKGVVTVDGAGSELKVDYTIDVGVHGNGRLNISGGAIVTADWVSINNDSILAINVGNGSLLNVGDGSGVIANNGTVRIFAGSDIASGNYTPISAGTWSGSGTYQAVGGKWNATSQTFTVSAVQSATSGTAVHVDLASIQRILVSDNGTGRSGWSVDASFLAATNSSALTFTATVMGGDTLSALGSLSGNKPVLGAWDFAATGGYTSGDPVYLSFKVGPVSDSDDLQLWHYDGTWTKYAATDWTYDGLYASFTATSFSGYAVTVPEPGTLAMLLAIALGLAIRVRRKRN